MVDCGVVFAKDWPGAEVVVIGIILFDVYIAPFGYALPGTMPGPPRGLPPGRLAPSWKSGLSKIMSWRCC